MSAGRVDPAVLAWPLDRIGEAAVALAHRSGLGSGTATAPRDPPAADPAALDRWLAATGEQLGVGVEPMLATYREVDAALADLNPALVQLADGVLAVLRQDRGKLVCPPGPTAPSGGSRGRPWDGCCRHATSRRNARDLGSPGPRAAAEPARARAEAGMLGELLAATTVLHAWLFRMPPAAPFAGQLRAAGLLRLAGGLIAAHAAHYALFLLSWWAIGRAVLGGRVAPGWLGGWALILLGSIPLLMLSTWCQGKLAVGIGMLLRRRLLAGALALPPETLNRDGIGRLLGRTLEADSLERLALGGGFLSALALLELALAAPVLAAGAGGAWHVGLLAVWLVLAAALGLRLARARYRWTSQRLALTGLTIEHIIGHRTRLAQELPDRWHDREDEALSRYLEHSAALDRRALALLVLVPRGWLLAGLGALAPAFVDGADARRAGHRDRRRAPRLAVARPPQRRPRSARERSRRVAARGAAVPRRRRPGSPEAPRPRRRAFPNRPTAPEYVVSAPASGTEPVLEAIDLAFRHATRAADVLSGCDLVVRRGDHVLIQGPRGAASRPWSRCSRACACRGAGSSWRAAWT